MLSVHLICVGKLKEKFYQEACAEYTKRLSAYCRLTLVELPEEKLPQHPWDDGTTLLPPAAYGTEVPLEKHGGSYRIYEPELDCVYVCRSVWDNGVAEHAWLVTEE